jgi:hypothetical protein
VKAVQRRLEGTTTTTVCLFERAPDALTAVTVIR